MKTGSALLLSVFFGDNLIFLYFCSHKFATIAQLVE